MYKTLGLIASTSLFVMTFTVAAKASEEMSCYVKHTTPIYSSTGENAQRVGIMSPDSRIDLSINDQRKRGWIRIFSFARRERIDAGDIAPKRISPQMYVYVENDFMSGFVTGCVAPESVENPQGQPSPRKRP